MGEVDDAVDRIVAGMEGTPMTEGKTKSLVAYHEVGHAICGTLTPGHDPVQKVTVIPRGQAKGLTWFIPGDDPTLISKSQLQARIVGALGGRAAEEVVFGMAEVGPWNLQGEQSGDMIMRMMQRSSMSEKLANDIDMAVQKIAEDGYATALKQIQDNKDAMDVIVEELMVSETMTGERFREILGSYTPIPEENIPDPVVAI